MTVVVRAGTPADADLVLALLDAAQRWLVAGGRTGQWGTQPFSVQPDQVRRVRGWAAGGGLRIAELAGAPVGAIAVGPTPDYAPPATGPELFVEGLVADRAHRGRGIGPALLGAAHAEAVRRGLPVVRLACWAGGDGALVRYYERAGFTRRERFSIGAWEGQTLARSC